MLKKLLFVFMFLTITNSLVLGGTTGKIAGVVKDTNTGDPLPAVNVVIQGTTMGAATDMEGRFFIINITPGVYDLKATMVGYSGKEVKNVKVSLDRTTTINFDLQETVIAGGEVVVVAGREKIRKDVSYSQVSISADEILAVPTGTDFRETIAMNAGILQDGYGHITIRGSGVDEVGLVVDGFNKNDDRMGQPQIKIPKAAVKEVQILTGGFNAEYGQARSGMINVITKEGSPNYRASIDYRMRPAGKKHFGPDIYGEGNYWQVGRYLSLEPTGDRNGDGKADFEGWNSWFEKNQNKALGSSPEECLEIWKYRHPNYDYHNKPDHYVEGTLSGPIPFTSNKLTFFLSGYYDYKLYPIRYVRPAFKDHQESLKLTYKPKADMTIRLKGEYGEVFSTIMGGSAVDSYGNPLQYTNPNHWRNLINELKGLVRKGLYNVDSAMKETALYNGLFGAELIHQISPKAFYTVNLQYSRTRSRTHPGRIRDLSIAKYFSDVGLDEAPYGFEGDGGNDQLGVWKISGDNGRRDYSTYHSFKSRGDFTSQLNPSHQLKTGVGANYIIMDLHYGIDLWRVNQSQHFMRWTATEVDYTEAYAYIQDKIEFEGMIMNVGLRADYFTNDLPVFTDPFSHYYSVGVNYDSLYFAPTKESTPKFVLSPRVGISHPISENSKVFFNYGYFYQRPDVTSFSRDYRRKFYSITQLSNPDLDYRKTISYELGIEQNVADLFSYTLSAYYKDVSREISNIGYQGTGSINYSSATNNRYRDVRGFELRIDIPFHRYFTGWVHYNYLIESSGQYGWSTIYEDPTKRNDLYSARSSQPRPRPWLRANLTFRTPIATNNASLLKKVYSDILISPYFQWRSGQWMTYHSENYPGYKDNNVHWSPWWNINLRVSKGFKILGKDIYAYTEIENLLNKKFLDVDSFHKQTTRLEYYLEYVSEDGGKPGDIEGQNVADYLDQGNYYILYGQPRDIWFGLRVEL